MTEDKISYTTHELTGYRMVVPLVKWLGHCGPKHHALIIGTNDADGKLYVSDFGPSRGSCMITIDQFIEIYGRGGRIKLVPNNGMRSNEEVVKHVLEEIYGKTSGSYNFVLNNCQNSVDRAMYGKRSLSSQVANTLSGLGFVLAGGIYVLARRLR